MSMLAAMQNENSDRISRATGLPPTRIEIPRPPFIGDSLTLHNISVSDSNIGAVNTGNIENLDAAVTVFQNADNPELAAALKETTEALLRATDFDSDEQQELAELLETLAAQAQVKSEQRLSFIPTLLTRAATIATSSASVIGAWGTLEPLLRLALGV